MCTPRSVCRCVRGRAVAGGESLLSGHCCFDGVAEVGLWCALQRVEAWEVGSIWQREVLRAADRSSSYSSMYEPVNTVMPVGSPVAV